MHQNNGFTLVEVLVAAAILFSTIATVSVIYSSALLSSDKASKTVDSLITVKPVIYLIKEQLQQSSKKSTEQHEGKGDIWGYKYSWVAKLTAFKAPTDKFNSDTGAYDKHPKRFKLWSVQLTITNTSTTKVFEYEELTWL
ncbi:prepilin-type N-terminal cleavage/methylation domain-containing protein [Catenovulum sp. SM1970]|uniref:PulJ/GspJ family protein n=1 Tax=Marinifaba aquimaris TaxID=2741323 RepID=UPI0015728E40|nr:prepilin-type N-terminal cleavage/methylation domain-containing protein [Marinifaba aquimaris]NTS76916.1 prepilin-type N-terminal cleavage/methylation domain-containing protein [Marinifaba aquimaris]